MINNHNINSMFQANNLRESPLKIGDKEFQLICELAKKKSGIILEGDRHRTMVQSRLGRRLRELKIGSFTDYCKLLENDHQEEELGHFIDAISTNVTAFFRESHHFDYLKDYLQQHIAQPEIKNTKRLRIWCSAASSGEEPYSIAMTILDILNDTRSWDIKILATDISNNALSRAMQAIYPIKALEAFPKGYTKRYTENIDNENFTIKPFVKEIVYFKHLNLLNSWPITGPFDAIFCRNVFIYFSAEVKMDIASRFAKILRVGSPLYIGHSESLIGLENIFQPSGRTAYINIGC